MEIQVHDLVLRVERLEKVVQTLLAEKPTVSDADDIPRRGRPRKTEGVEHGKEAN